MGERRGGHEEKARAGRRAREAHGSPRTFCRGRGKLGRTGDLVKPDTQAPSGRPPTYWKTRSHRGDGGHHRAATLLPVPWSPHVLQPRAHQPPPRPSPTAHLSSPVMPPPPFSAVPTVPTDRLDRPSDRAYYSGEDIVDGAILRKGVINRTSSGMVRVAFQRTRCHESARDKGNTSSSWRQIERFLH